MTIDIDVPGLKAQLTELGARFEAVDEEKITREAARRIAEEAADMVRQAVIAEDDITSPAMNSIWGRGGDDRSEGPSMATRAAWVVSKEGPNTYSMQPHPRVRQRAHVLNYGYGTITPNDANYLRFYLEGSPIFRKSVDGPDETGYWQAAFTRLENSGRPMEIMNEVLEDEVEEKF